MIKAKSISLSRILIVAATASCLTLGVASVASASTDTTEPTDPETTHDMGDDTETTMAPGADGSAEPSSPEAAAFCEAELAAEVASGSEDPAVFEAAMEALRAAAPEDIAATVEDVIANGQSGPGDPAFDEPYAAMIDYMRANCGYAELNITASEYAFGGLPPDVAAGPTIVSMANIGEELHEIAIFRINDDVTLTAEELMALPEEEAFSMVTPAGFSFAFPGATGYTVTDFTPGRYVAACFLPEGALPEVMEQMEGPGSSTPPGVELGPPHFTLGMLHEFTVGDGTTNTDTTMEMDMTGTTEAMNDMSATTEVRSETTAAG